jgi:hypothetical protein
VRRLIPHLTLLLILGAGGTASAQAIEAGGSVAVSCKGSDGSFCNDDYSGLATGGPYLSVWLADRIEVGGRIAWLEQPDARGEAGFPFPYRFTIQDRVRTIVQGEATWHFRRGKRLRPMVGLGFGAFHDGMTTSCMPAGCEAVLLSPPRILLGESTVWHSDVSIMTGVSVAATDRIRIRGGWRYHNPFRDELALSELFLAAGYRF